MVTPTIRVDAKLHAHWIRRPANQHSCNRCGVQEWHHKLPRRSWCDPWPKYLSPVVVVLVQRVMWFWCPQKRGQCSRTLWELVLRMDPPIFNEAAINPCTSEISLTPGIVNHDFCSWTSNRSWRVLPKQQTFFYQSSCPKPKLRLLTDERNAIKASQARV